MTDLTTEKRAELRDVAEWGRGTMSPWLKVTPADLLALLDAADERDRLAGQVERVHEYGIMRPASMPDMSGRPRYTQIVGTTFPTEEQARAAARRVPVLRGVPATICRRVAPGEWELA